MDWVSPSGCCEGGGRFQSSPRPPSRSPQVFEDVFLQIQIFGETSGAQAPKNFFLAHGME